MQKTLKQLTYAAFAVGALASCNEYVDYTEGSITSSDAKFEEKVAEFDEAFIEHFGEPDPNHMWGQDLPIKPMMFSYVSGATRAEAQGANQNVNVNKNQWCERDPQDPTGYHTKNDNLLIDKFQVPGWPNFDGYYYASTGEGALKNILTKDEMFANNSYQPVGDVTDYEIQYVSTWFRTHQHPKSISLHLTDFFIQNISCDKDQLTYDGAIDDAYSYSDPTSLGGLAAPGPNGINVEKTSDVLNDDNTKKAGVVPNVERISQNKSNEQLNYSMDYLHFGAVGYPFETTLANGLGTGWTHVNNYNNGNTNYDPEHAKERGFREIKYIYSSGTEDFACRCSWGTDKPWIHDWVLVRLEWVEPASASVDGQPHKREGYYLGFDFHGKTNDTEIKKDGFYSNWIIKISPAHFTPRSNFSKRVMCEDLGGSFDFDYNDVVFDVAFDASTGENEAIISLQAAGGTLPIQVGADIPNAPAGYQEAHSLLGHDISQPVNVDAGASHEVAIYRVPVTATSANDNFYASIPIKIKQDGNNWITQYVQLGATAKNDYQWEPNVPIKPGNPGHYNVEKDAKTPLKFVTEVGVKWMKELRGLDYGYNHFYEWVKDPNFLYDLNSVKIHWYDAKSKKEWIYKGEEEEMPSPTTPVDQQILTWWQIDEAPVTENFTSKDLATKIISIDKYSLETNSIINKFNSDPDAEHITFAYILKAAPGQTVNAVMIPIWVENGKAYYKYNDGRASVEITDEIIRKADYRESVWQPSFTQKEGYDSAGNGKPGQDVDGNYTYVSKFSFNIDDMCVRGKDGAADKYCDYIMLVVKENIDMTTTPFSYKQSAPVSKYMCFCMF